MHAMTMNKLLLTTVLKTLCPIMALNEKYNFLIEEKIMFRSQDI